MRIAVRLDRLRLMRWHLILIDSLRQQGHVVGAEMRDGAEPHSATLRILFEIEARQFK
jgi:hypothetical protein